MAKGMSLVPRPNKSDSDPPSKERRRPSHLRRRHPDNTTRVVRVKRDPIEPTSRANDNPNSEAWAGLVNDPPTLPDPPLHREPPPPAPLPSEPPENGSIPPAWDTDRQRMRRLEETVGIVGLAILVGAMLVAMWLRMTSG